MQNKVKNLYKNSFTIIFYIINYLLTKNIIQLIFFKWEKLLNMLYKKIEFNFKNLRKLTHFKYFLL